jgi:hypothetical protein
MGFVPTTASITSGFDRALSRGGCRVDPHDAQICRELALTSSG